MVWGIFSWHSLGALVFVEGTMDQQKYASFLVDHVHSFLKMMASANRTMRSVSHTQLAVYVHGSKNTRMSLPYFPGQQSPRT
ncbi:hypothetical protein X975_16862, partial [Stegodyphus mimosarum]